MKTPGFLRCKVTAHVGDRKYEGLATAAYAPEQCAAYYWCFPWIFVNFRGERGWKSATPDIASTP
ncbi:MAG: hypothetical protein ACLSFW_17915 [Bacteroides cellulosilyticus]